MSKLPHPKGWSILNKMELRIKPIEITKEESLALLEEMQESYDKICPHCNGIILWKRGRPMYKDKKTGKSKYVKNKETLRYTCQECGKFFQLNSTNPKIRGEVAKFIFNNMYIVSEPDLCRLSSKYFKVSITPPTISLFKKLTKLKKELKNGE